VLAGTAIETDQTGWGLREAEELVAEAEALGDPRVLVTVLRPLAWLQFWTGRAAEGLATAQRGLAIAQKEGGLEREAADAYRAQSTTQIWGPTPVGQMLEWGRRVLEEKAGTAIEAYARGVMAMAHAMRGERDEAEAATDRSIEILEEFGGAVMLAAAHVPGYIRLLLGDPVGAEATLRPGIQILERMGERGFLSTTAALLAEALYRQGRDDEAAEQARRCEELAAPDDIASQIGWRMVRARVLARRGRAGGAERLAREAVALVRETDHMIDLGGALQTLAEVLVTAGDREGSRAAAEEALAVHERKGNRAGAARTRALLEGE
jgi:tetratricopeptide (TPR) repeat protein